MIGSVTFASLKEPRSRLNFHAAVGRKTGYFATTRGSIAHLVISAAKENKARDCQAREIPHGFDAKQWYLVIGTMEPYAQNCKVHTWKLL